MWLPLFFPLILHPCDGTHHFHFHLAAVYTRCVMTLTLAHFLRVLFVFHLHSPLYLKPFNNSYYSRQIILPWLSSKTIFYIIHDDLSTVTKRKHISWRKMCIVVSYRNVSPLDRVLRGIYVTYWAPLPALTLCGFSLHVYRAADSVTETTVVEICLLSFSWCPAVWKPNQHQHPAQHCHHTQTTSTAT